MSVPARRLAGDVARSGRCSSWRSFRRTKCGRQCAKPRHSAIRSRCIMGVFVSIGFYITLSKISGGRKGAFGPHDSQTVPLQRESCRSWRRLYERNQKMIRKGRLWPFPAPAKVFRRRRSSRCQRSFERPIPVSVVRALSAPFAVTAGQACRSDVPSPPSRTGGEIATAGLPGRAGACE